MEKVGINIARFQIKKARKPNAFYDICSFAADLYNKANGTSVLPARFFKDCKNNRKAYELAQIDYCELKHLCTNSGEQARLFFGQLKKRKQTL